MSHRDVTRDMGRYNTASRQKSRIERIEKPTLFYPKWRNQAKKSAPHHSATQYHPHVTP